MGVLAMVLGPTGSGKSTSLLHFGPEDAEIFGVTGKRLPFRTPLPMHANATYQEIFDALRRNERKVYVIDDSTYLMQFDNFRRAREKGYDKFVAMAVNFETLLDAAMRCDADTCVYFLHHPQFGEDGGAKPQTIGKMLDNQLCVEGLFDWCSSAPSWTAGTSSTPTSTASPRRRSTCSRSRSYRTTWSW